MQNAGVRFMLGGGFAMAGYTGRWRNTKDIDFYILKSDREKTVAALTAAGFEDYFERVPYDRKWIYRSTRSEVIVDIIWAMANQRTEVDEHWFERAPSIHIRGKALKVVPMEEFIWCKLYIFQRDHCDWTDVLNVLFAAGTRINWDHLLWRLEDDWPLLKALLILYGWLCPRRAILFPDSLLRKLRLEKPEISRRPKRNRISLLDSRAWFSAILKSKEPLAV
jgi:predicted nucleotidyltransferase